jgi:hypothetical protein
VTAALTDVCPENFLRAGAVFGQVAEQLTGTIAQAHRSAEVDWIGPPGQAYRHDLDQLVTSLRRIQRAYDGACDALVAYSRSLVQVRDLAVQAAALASQAASLEQQRMIDATYLPIVIHPMTVEQERLQVQSRILSEAADRAEFTASTRLALTLRDLADDAPHQSGWQSANRTAGRFGAAAGQQIGGALSMVGSAYLSAPFIGDAASREAARQELKQDALAMAQPWLAIEGLLKELGDGRFAQVSGSLAGGLLMRRWGATGKKVDLFGTHDGLPEPVMLAMRRGIDPNLPAVKGWVLAHEQDALGDLFETLQTAALPDVEGLIKNGADLLVHEARGGHTLLKHIGRDAEFLRRRMELEPSFGVLVPKSSFLSLDEAERVIAGGLATAAGTLRAWAAGTQKRIRLVEPLATPAGLLVNLHGQVVEAERLVMDLVRNRDGSVRLVTAFVKE